MTRSTAVGYAPGAGIVKDFLGRRPHYISDWVDGFKAHIHILAPSTYIFFASVIPALTFGEQLADDTEGHFNGVHVLFSTAICGIMQAIVGGQPLVIVGVAEPIVLVYGYMYIIAKQYAIPFVSWASVSLFWASFFIGTLAILNTCSYIHHFTRFSGELFGFLIAVLFLQQAVKGLASEFDVPKVHIARRGEYGGASEEHSWLMFNGAFALFLACGLLGTSLLSIGARHWVLFNSTIRRIIADYGSPFSVLLWTLVSFIPRGTPDAIPRRLVIPNTFDGSDNYGVLGRLGELEAWHIGAAIIPGAIIAILYFFDQNVSSQLCQEGFHLKKPTAYHWDFMLLAVMLTVCGLIGIPPVNAVIPQAPMHSRANTVWRKDKKDKDAEYKGEALDDRPYNIFDDIHGGRDYYIRENRVSGLLQSILCGVCLLITPVLQLIPRSVLWGYFAFMAIEGLPGSQFYKRMKLFFSDSSKFHHLLKVEGHESYLDNVPKSTIFKFTLMQFIGFGICYGITWAGIGGISFPLFIFLIVPARQYLFVKLFSEHDLQELDPLHLDGPEPSASQRLPTEAASTLSRRSLAANANGSSAPVPPRPQQIIQMHPPMMPMPPGVGGGGYMTQMPPIPIMPMGVSGAGATFVPSPPPV